MKKFIFSLIFVVSTLFSFGQYQNFDDSNVFTITSNPTWVGGNVYMLNQNNQALFQTNNTGIGQIVSIDLNISVDSISFDYIINNGSLYFNTNLVNSSSTFSSILSTNTITFKVKAMSGNDADIIVSNIKLFNNGLLINPVGIKSLEQRQLNLFTYNNKIKVNGQIDEKLKLNVFNILGQLVIQTDLKNEIETNVATGVYILQVLDEHDNSIETKKVLLQN